MALDRQSIEKRDFPIGRRGYEPEAVDAHLARIAEEVEDLRRRAGSGGGASAAPAGKSSPASIAQAASEQVMAIVQAAEASAAAIEQGAEDEAARIRSEAESDARSTRDEAVDRSQQHVGQVSSATKQMLQRVDAMESELSGLVESLRTGANRLTADLSLLEGGMGDLYDAAGRGEGGAPAAPAAPRVVESVPLAAVPDAPAPAAAQDDELDVADEAPDDALFEADEPEAGEDLAVEDTAAIAPRGEAAPSGDGDTEGARLVALNMALNGTSRQETDRYLAENFDLADRAGLLDEVYATVES
jgi:DivIVA domain-containing protein